MSLECPRSPVYHTSAEQKAQSRNAAKIYRYGSPKLRDLLRQKCRIRAHEARQNSFEKSRDLNGCFTRRLEILREEVAELDLDIDMQEGIYKELLDEVNDWFAGQQEEEENYIINMGESDDLICPVCQKLPLKCEPPSPTQLHFYVCPCGVRFQTTADMSKLRNNLTAKIDAHENCSAPLTFIVEPATDGVAAIAFGGAILSGMCESCDYFCSF